MTPLASSREAPRPVRVAFTAAVGSHLDTASCIERAMRTDIEGLACTVVDLVGFSRWDAKDVPYVGHAERVSFDLQACGVNSPRIDSATWPAVLRGAVELVARIEPDVLVTMDDSWYDQHALILAASRSGVPVVLVQEGPFADGIASGKRRPWRVSFSRSEFADSRLVRRLRGRPVSVRLPSYGRGRASLVLAASGWYRSRFIASGVPAHRVEVTGVPRYDSIPGARQEWIARRRAATSVRRPKVLLLSQPFVRYNELSEADYGRLAAIARSALKEVAQRDGVAVEVRLHPSDRLQDVEGLIGDQLEAELVRPVKPLVESLAAFDVVVGFSSSGLLEAMAVGVPTVVIETPPIAFRTEFFRSVGVPVATDATAAARHIACAIASGDSPVLLPRVTDEMGVLDGMASNRVVRQCWSLLAGNSRIPD